MIARLPNMLQSSNTSPSIGRCMKHQFKRNTVCRDCNTPRPTAVGAVGTAVTTVAVTCTVVDGKPGSMPV